MDISFAPGFKSLVASIDMVHATRAKRLAVNGDFSQILDVTQVDPQCGALLEPIRRRLHVLRIGARP